MNAPLRQAHPADALGGEKSTLTFAELASRVGELNPRALSPHEYPDVVTILEYMRGECVKRHLDNLAKEKVLSEREAAVAKRESNVALRIRVVEAAIKASRPSRWRRMVTYFGR